MVMKNGGHDGGGERTDDPPGGRGRQGGSERVEIPVSCRSVLGRQFPLCSKSKERERKREEVALEQFTAVLDAVNARSVGGTYEGSLLSGRSYR